SGAQAARSLAPLWPGLGEPTSGEQRVAALRLATIVMEKALAPDRVTVCRNLARASLTAEDVPSRVAAIHLAMQPLVGLTDQVVALLNDPAPEVRQVALLAVGMDADTVATDDLLRWLHDPNDDVRRLCEGALRGRGLQEEHIRLGRLITDSRAAARLQVLD